MSSGSPTIKPFSAFNVDEDAKTLRAAMKGLGTDEDNIIAVLTRRSTAQRMQIKQHFAQTFGRDLIDDLKSELGSSLERVVLGLMMEPAECDAFILHHAIKGAGTDEDTLIEIICTRNNKQIAEINKAYSKKYEASLEEDVAGETRHYLQQVLIACLQGRRQDGPVNMQQAKTDAAAIFEAGENKSGTEEEVFISILCTRSPAMLRAIFTEYEKLAQKSIVETIESEMSGNLEKALITIVKIMISAPSHFAFRLNDAMKGAGTNEDLLIHTIVSRAEIDLSDIKYAYQKEFGTALIEAVDSEIGGSCGRALVSILNGN